MAFSDSVRSTLSMEAGGFCANPDCPAYTGIFVPGYTKSGGDGAHIVAENPNGPRGQSPMTPAQRSMANNGIWLCPNCHRKVDILQPQNYSVELLHQWKANAVIYAQQAQGKSLQALAWPDVRPQVNRPNAASMQGADKFAQFHKPLAIELGNLRYQLPAMFQKDVSIPESVEREIRMKSSGPKIGWSWQSEWSTTYYCDDQELIQLMHALIHAADNLRPPTNQARSANFSHPDALAQAITNYLNAWDTLKKCLQKHENWET